MRKVVLGLTLVSVITLAGSKLSSGPAAHGFTVAHLAAIALEGPVAKVEQVEEPSGSTSDHAALLALNEDYIRSVQTGDVVRFEEILADDFRASLGTTYLSRGAFLAQTALPVTISNLTARDVEIRVMGDAGIVHARTTYRTLDGQERSGRYTDVWVRESDGWQAVAAHVTR